MMARSRVRTRLVLLTASALTFASLEADAQTDSDRAGKAQIDSLRETPAEISIADVPRELDATRDDLRALQAELEATATDSTVVEDLRTLRSEIDALVSSDVARDPGAATWRGRRELVSSCRRRIAKLDEWARTLEERAQRLDNRRGELTAALATWDRLRAQLDEDNLGAALSAEVDAVTAEQRSTASRIDERYAGVLDLRTRVSDQKQRLTEVLDRLAATGQPGLLEMLKPDSPPLWALSTSATPEKSLTAQVADAWRDAFAPLPGFLVERLFAIVAQALLFAGLLVAILLARRRARESADADAPSVGATSFARPISTAFIAAVILSRVFYPYAPAIFAVLIRSVTVPALIRLAPRLLPARYVGVFIAISLVYLLNMTDFLVVQSAVLHRVHLLIVSLLALIVSLTGLRRIRDTERGWRKNLLRTLGWIAAGLFAASSIANGYGATQLAVLLTTDVLQLLYIGIVVLMGIRIVEDGTAIAFRNEPLQRLRSVRLHRSMLERRTSWVIRGLVIFIGARAILDALGIERILIDGFMRVMNTGGTVGALTVTLGDFFAFVFTLWIAIQISRFLQFVLGEDILPGFSLARGVPNLITRLTHYAVITIGFVLAVAASGADLSKLAILAGGLGVGVGFGLQAIVNNFISGMILMFERPMQVGDTVEVGTLIGQVKSIGLRASTVRTYSGAEVVVPNGNLVANEVVNWTLSDRKRRIELPVGVAYGSDPDQVSSILLATADAHEEALKHPEPLAVFLGFGESALQFELRFWTREFGEWQRIRGEVATQVQRRFAEAGIEIPFPQRTVHLRPGPEDPSGSGSES